MSDERIPSWEQLIDWVDGRLPQEQVAPVEKLIADGDPTVSVDLKWLQMLQRATQEVHLDAPPPTVRVNLRADFESYRQQKLSSSGLPFIDRLVATLTFDSGFEPGLVGARAALSTQPRQLIYATDMADIALTIQSHDDGLEIEGQLLALVDMSPELFTARLGALVPNKGSEQQIFNESAVSPLDELGNFSFTNLKSDSYALRIECSGVELMIESIDLEL